MDENKNKARAARTKRKCSREILLVLKCGLEADSTQKFHASPRPQDCYGENTYKNQNQARRPRKTNIAKKHLLKKCGTEKGCSKRATRNHSRNHKKLGIA